MKRALSVIVLLAACTTTATEPPYSVAGQWQVTQPAAMTLTISEDGGALSGVALLDNGGQLNLTIEGTFVYPRVSILMSAPGTEDAAFFGFMTSESELQGELRLGANERQNVTFTRVP